MTPEDFSYFQSRVTRFISGSSSGIKFGSSVTPRYTRLSSIIPRRAVPKQVLEKIQGGSGSDDNIDTSTRGVSALGRVTLNLEQTKNNLEKIFQIIADDYKSTREQNRKEIDEYRKRVANRGRVFGKRELGDKKSDILGTIRKYVGSFFSGTGGAIRALAMFNLLQGLLSGDPSKIIGPLLGIGLTYIPSIIGNVIGGVVGGVGTALAGRMFGGGARAAGAASGAGTGASKGKFGGKAALIGGGLALASGLFNKPQEEDQQQQRLQQLTEQQKGSVGPQSLVPLPQDELKRFDNLNKKFEAALDFLLKKQKEGGGAQGTRSSGTGAGPSPGPGLADPGVQQMTTLTGIHKQAADIISSHESAGSGNYNAMNRGTAGDSPEGPMKYFGKNLTDMSIGEVIDLQKANKLHAAGRYQFVKNTLPTSMKSAGLSRSDKFDALSQDKMFVATLQKRGWQPWDPAVGGGPAYTPQQIAILERASRTRVSGSAAAAAPSPQPTPQPRSAAPRPPMAASPNVTVLPLPVNTGQQQQTSAASPGSTMVPPIDTTYPENFLALYSKLIYQIV